MSPTAHKVRNVFHVKYDWLELSSAAISDALRTDPLDLLIQIEPSLDQIVVGQRTGETKITRAHKASRVVFNAVRRK